jgi:phosphate transport system protein
MSQDAFHQLSELPDDANRGSFDRQLNEVEDGFVGAALVVVESMPGLSASFLDAEVAAIDRAREMAADVGARIRQVEDAGFILLAREAPVGRDLRRLVAILRLATDIERSANLLRHVSESVEHLDARQLPEGLRVKLREMAERSADVLRAGIDAWRARDGLALTEVDELDELVDSLQISLLEDAADERRLGNELMAIGLIARYYERIADHGVALAKDTAFVVTGQRIASPSA